MKFEVKDEKNCGKKISVKIGKERIAETEKKVFAGIKNGARIDGYRKGKAPDSVIEKQFKDLIKEEVIKEVVPAAYTEIMDELKLHVVSSPSLDEVRYDGENKDEISFTIGVEVNPEITVKEYKGAEIKGKELKEVTDKDVEREINRVRQYRGSLKDSMKDKAEQDDYVTFSMLGFVDGASVDELSDDSHFIQLGAGNVLKELEDGIKGMKPGQEKDINATFPKDYFNNKYAGKKALFKVTLKNIKALEMPELNDEFAKSLGNFENVDALKKQVKEELEKQAAADVKNFKIEQVFKKLIEDNVFDVPSSLVAQEKKNMTARYKNTLSQQGLSFEKMGLKEEDIMEKGAKQAEESVRLIYILRKIAENEKIDVSDADEETEIKKIAESVKQDAAVMMKQAKARGNWDSLKAKLLEDKVVEHLISSVKFK